MRKTALSAVAALTLFAASAFAEETVKQPPDLKWSFEGVFGKFDAKARKRGFQVYNATCGACHSLRLLSYRNLMEIGYTKDEVKAIAAEYEVEAGPNDEGDMYARPALPSDKFVPPFANEKAARAANGGALPPDLSVIIKARKNGADYVHALLTGYRDEAPKGIVLSEGMNYNDFFPGRLIAMAPPLFDDAVEYDDGTKPTLDQHAKDVVEFLTWAASPEMEARKSLGVKVMLFLIVLTVMLYAVKRKVWKKLH